VWREWGMEMRVSLGELVGWWRGGVVAFVEGEWEVEGM